MLLIPLWLQASYAHFCGAKAAQSFGWHASARPYLRDVVVLCQLPKVFVELCYAVAMRLLRHFAQVFQLPRFHLVRVALLSIRSAVLRVQPWR